MVSRASAVGCHPLRSPLSEKEEVDSGDDLLVSTEEASARPVVRLVDAILSEGIIARASERPRNSIIYIFLSGGLAQHESFDLKPDAADGIRGEFRPIATRTPGIQICEHLPRLAQRWLKTSCDRRA